MRRVRSGDPTRRRAQEHDGRCRFSRTPRDMNLAMDLPTRPPAVIERDARVLERAPVGRRCHRLIVAPE